MSDINNNEPAENIEQPKQEPEDGNNSMSVDEQPETSSTNLPTGDNLAPMSVESPAHLNNEDSPKSDDSRERHGSNYVIEPHLELRDMAKDKTLENFLAQMDDYSPLIPDVLLDYYLSLSGFKCVDPRLKKLLGLTAQKFISDVAQDAYQYSKIRTGSSNASSTTFGAQNFGAGGASGIGSSGRRGDRGKTVLTVDDLSAALNEYGINLKRPDFFR
ncbi:Transcription initiation factor TFIID 23-30kDa subunit-domain-containing protein [Schizosaccharomyces pombe]|uniref:SAGA complex/transcription factor TFIID complex subunit Taf10 n=1 Tax=Schizosaccharomyces pombe (strain 972 / ATCC 24843) TaxID=284812 RepID=TAF10_SCHPO|nr:SAGA complex/transcription factor TFIID complex subunit Taf10 [Schizosaccharomyces pombe]O60171.1 RecName: Full=Transcription initiation factor TFIID subunit 10; AltName: Full=TBP-associated factor 10 [Schizosaccharomyces pombe 972h-]CAA18862.1 SAGA complex/transcription factor TFIID complex subunit Taf10 [Schizosaccharomyces pombe]|eukprot:NP_595927.1 SAGA complex/transcription factor TFIID complex subunit Taf10 [Schizosaccharomyces pombe]